MGRCSSARPGSWATNPFRALPAPPRHRRACMPTVRDVVAAGAAIALRPFGFEVRDRVLSEKPEGFPGYLEAAHQLGMDVNDYEESQLGWYPALELLEATTFPSLTASSIV